MKLSTKNKAKGKLHEVKGGLKVKAGRLMRNSRLETKGKAEKRAGKVQNTLGKIEGIVGA
jgi:uncharacterized protein YjbJ (UPF0337 family)